MLDDMAALCGVGDEVAGVTRAAMEGGTALTFAESLEKRVAFLKDAPADIIDEALAGVRLQPGARAPHRLLQRTRPPQLHSLGRLHALHACRRAPPRHDGDFSNVLGIDRERNTLTGTVTGPAADAFSMPTANAARWKSSAIRRAQRSAKPSPPETAPTTSR